MTIDIIGGGIGGLSLAISLKQAGLSVRVFEQTAELRPVGAGINLACNAMQVYDRLGLRQKIEHAGHICRRMQVTDHQLSSLSVVDILPFEQKYGVQNVAIHRARLQDILLAELSEGELFLDKQLVAIQKAEGQQVNLAFKDGSTYTSECVIGADGIDSSVRKCWFNKGTIRPAQQSCWRGVTQLQLPAPYADQLTEAWGPGGRLGFVPIDSEQVYWFAVTDSFPTADSMDKSDLLAQFVAFSPLATQLLSSTPETAIHLASLSDLTGLKQWHQAQVCLIGDAAHATTPNLGQGACQAIEDAYFLAQCLQEHAPEAAFVRFQANRQAKVKQIVNTSWMVGKMGHWQNSIAVGLRNILLRATPPSIGQRQSDAIYRLGF